MDETELDDRLTFEEPDSEVLADRIRWILDVDQDTYDRLSIQSREVVETQHSLENQMARIANVFETTFN